MPKMSDIELRSILMSNKLDSLAAMRASKLSVERERATMYYLGDMSSDMPAPTGRSEAVSFDVADTVEGLMPQLMEIFAGTDQVVEFDPVGPEDEEAAQQESDYVNHVFMNQNPGFVTMYAFIKDALLSKNGIVKIWWEETDREERQTYYDLDDDQLAMLVNDQDVEIVEHTIKDQPGDEEEPSGEGEPAAVTESTQ